MEFLKDKIVIVYIPILTFITGYILEVVILNKMDLEYVSNAPLIDINLLIDTILF